MRRGRGGRGSLLIKEMCELESCFSSEPLAQHEIQAKDQDFIVLETHGELPISM